MAESGNSRPVSSSDATYPTANISPQFLEKPSTSDRKESKFWLDPEEYTLRKRLPPSLPRRNSDVYVTNKTNFKAQLDR